MPIMTPPAWHIHARTHHRRRSHRGVFVVDKGSRMTCPSSAANGCRCPEHELGLAIYARDHQAYAQALDTVRQPVRLSIVTFGPNAEQPCAGGMTCTCPTCSNARRAAIERGAQGEGNANPFKTRRAA